MVGLLTHFPYEPALWRWSGLILPALLTHYIVCVLSTRGALRDVSHTLSVAGLAGGSAVHLFTNLLMFAKDVALWLAVLVVGMGLMMHVLALLTARQLSQR